MSVVLGVDPGRYGAAVLLDGAVVRGWWAWSLRQRGCRLRDSRGTNTHLCTLTAAMHAIEHYLPLYSLLVVETVHVARGHAGIVALAESAGIAIGILSGGRHVYRVRASEWRRVVLGLPASTPADYAEERAVAWARARLDWSAVGGWPADATPPPRLSYASEGAIAEAAAIATWGARSVR